MTRHFSFLTSPRTHCEYEMEFVTISEIIGMNNALYAVLVIVFGTCLCFDVLGDATFVTIHAVLKRGRHSVAESLISF